MTGLVRKATLLAVLGLLMTSAVALAGIPDPAHCTYPSLINVMGTKDGVVDPYGEFTIELLDVYSNPVIGCYVTITESCSDVTICSAGPVPAGQTNTCGTAPTSIVSGWTDENGQITFRIAGASDNNLGNELGGCGLGGASIMVCNSILLGTAILATFDENGAATNPGVEVTDLSAWMADFVGYSLLGSPYMGRSDFSGSSTIDVVDLSRWVQVMTAAGQPSQAGCGGAGAYCP